MNSRELREKLLQIGPGHDVEGHELCRLMHGRLTRISIDGETIMNCDLCHDGYVLTIRYSTRWWRELPPARPRR